MCYFLAAETFKIDNFLDVIAKFTIQNNDKEIFIIYQNPKKEELNENWNKLKQKLTKFRTLRSNNGLLTVIFDDVVGNWWPRIRPDRPVYFDYLHNR